MTATCLPSIIQKGNGRPIVLLHGLGNNHKSWSFVTKKLRDFDCHTIALDLLGFGDAPKPDSISYSPKDHATAVIKTLDQLNINDVIIAGHSMGCIIAIEIAKQRPDLARHLVLMGAPLYETMPKSSWWSRLTRSGGAYFAIFSIVKKNPDAVQTGGKIADELVPFIKGLEITPETWPAYRKSLEHTIMQFQTFKDAQRLSVPTLFINGMLDFFIIRKNIRSIARHNKRLIKVESALGPHELTPLQGRKIAKVLHKLSINALK